jgi:hypothetical protein
MSQSDDNSVDAAPTPAELAAATQLAHALEEANRPTRDGDESALSAAAMLRLGNASIEPQASVLSRTMQNFDEKLVTAPRPSLWKWAFAGLVPLVLVSLFVMLRLRQQAFQEGLSFDPPGKVAVHEVLLAQQAAIGDIGALGRYEVAMQNYRREYYAHLRLRYGDQKQGTKTP